MRTGWAVLRALTGLRVGELVMLRQAVGDHPRGSLVRIDHAIETERGMAYTVQPLREHRDERGGRTLVPDGARLTLERSELARSLPGLRSGPTTLSGAVVQGIEDLVEDRRP